jgi:hypothetical protein
MKKGYARARKKRNQIGYIEKELEIGLGEANLGL